MSIFHQKRVGTVGAVIVAIILGETGILSPKITPDVQERRKQYALARMRADNEKKKKKKKKREQGELSQEHAFHAPHDDDKKSTGWSRLALFLATLASLALAAPFSGDTNDTDPSLAPWTNLGITPDDAASFAASGVSPAEGANIIATEEALFNGEVALTQLVPSTYTKSGTQSNMVLGAYSAAAAMGMANTADTADGVNLKLVVVVGWRRQHVGVTWRREGSGTVDLAMRFRDALWKLCPEDRPAERACSSQDEEHITDIYYNVGKSAYVGIKIASYEMPTNTRTLLIRALWGVFKEITECDTSRYQLRGWGKHHEACREFANSADQIEVRLENTRGPGEKPGTYVDPHLRVSIQFNGKTDEGPFDCVGTQSAIW
ncbi:hypothetical protein SLS60_009107 [Paraconiothyrium brasiliense]|uniref:Uncharacterized protein n=1 Tax=Paraconiothyrium brasiliense TaxID=300254 RepID=A0ABR3QWC8_9PLEO